MTNDQHVHNISLHERFMLPGRAYRLVQASAVPIDSTPIQHTALISSLVPSLQLCHISGNRCRYTPVCIKVVMCCVDDLFNL